MQYNFIFELKLDEFFCKCKYSKNKIYWNISEFANFHAIFQNFFSCYSKNLVLKIEKLKKREKILKHSKFLAIN